MDYIIEKRPIKWFLEKIDEKKLYLKNIKDLDSDEYNLSADETLEKENFDEYNIQRAFVWSHLKQVKLIESIFEDLLIPSIILHLNPDHQFEYTIIDGKQRLNTIWLFSRNLSLRAEILARDKDGIIKKIKKYYSDLDQDNLERFLNFQIPTIIIQKVKEDRLKQIFKILNIDSISLKPQEIRHAIDQNDLTKILNEFNTKNINGTLTILENFKKTNLISEAKIMSRGLDEFLIKLLRLWFYKDIVNDNKPDLDKFYELESKNDQEKLFKHFVNHQNEFYTNLALSIKLYLGFYKSIDKPILKPILIYILFYELTQTDNLNQIIKNPEIIEEKILDADDIKLNDPIIFTLTDVFKALSKNAKFSDAIRNQNTIIRRKKAIYEFENEFIKRTNYGKLSFDLDEIFPLLKQNFDSSHLLQ